MAFEGFQVEQPHPARPQIHARRQRLGPGEGEVIATYTDGTTARLALNNPMNWWPINEDYFIDDYAFARPEPLPPRVDLKTGKIRLLDMETFKGRGGKVSGGAATVLDLPLDENKELK